MSALGGPSEGPTREKKKKQKREQTQIKTEREDREKKKTKAVKKKRGRLRGNEEEEDGDEGRRGGPRAFKCLLRRCRKSQGEAPEEVWRRKKSGQDRQKENESEEEPFCSEKKRKAIVTRMKRGREKEEKRNKQQCRPIDLLVQIIDRSSSPYRPSSRVQTLSWFVSSARFLSFSFEERKEQK